MTTVDLNGHWSLHSLHVLCMGVLSDYSDCYWDMLTDYYFEERLLPLKKKYWYAYNWLNGLQKE